MIAAIGIGSNLDSVHGTREGSLREAIHRMGALGEIVAVSSFYDTAPVGYLDQPRFLNGAVLLDTDLEPEALLEGLLAVERSMGRDRTQAVAKGPRIVDLDLLLAGDTVLQSEFLTLPHPEMTSRRFVLEPLAEIAPEMIHPTDTPRSGRLLEQL